MPLSLLSGSNTPLQSISVFLRTIMGFSPPTHFVSVAQSILFRGAELGIVWPHFVQVAFAVALFLAMAVFRFRSVAERSE